MRQPFSLLVALTIAHLAHGGDDLRGNDEEPQYRLLGHTHHSGSGSGSRDDSGMESPSNTTHAPHNGDHHHHHDHDHDGKGKGSKQGKSAKSGKGGKGGKGHKGSKGSKGSKSQGHHSSNGGKNPHDSPTETPSSKGSDSRPPTPVTPPTTDTAPSTAPEVACDQPVQLSEYVLAYTLGSDSVPGRADFVEVAALTSQYFSDFMLANANYIGASLVRFDTTFVTSSDFRFGVPVEIEYSSVACFTSGSVNLPSAETLDSDLEGSLVPPDTYLASLVALGPLNVLSATTGVAFQAPSASTARSGPGITAGSSAAIAASAVGLTLLVAGVVLYRRGGSREEEFYNAKSSDKSDQTLAGETYAGDTYDGSTSYVHSASGAAKDEEDGLINIDLSGKEEASHHSKNEIWKREFVTESSAYENSGASEDSEESESLLVPPPVDDSEETADMYEEELTITESSLSNDVHISEIPPTETVSTREGEQLQSNDSPLSVEEIETLLQSF